MSRVPGIYQIKCIAINKIYIGGSNNIVRRRYEHYWGLRSGNHPNVHLQAAFNEYKEESFEFEVIELVDDVALLLEREQFYIDETQCYRAELGFNINQSAAHDLNERIPVIQLDYVSLEEIEEFDSIQQAEIALGGEDCWRRDNIGACIRGSQQTAYGYRWIKKGEQKPDFNQINWYPKPVVKFNLTTGEILHIYNSIRHAELGEKQAKDSGIRNTCLNKQNSSLGYGWKYIDDTTPYFCGIDPGKSGCITLFNEKRSLFFPLPTIGKEYDIQKISLFFKAWRSNIQHAGLEHVHAIQGKTGNSSNFNFGLGKGILMSMLVSSEIPHTLIPPQTWQREAHQGVTKVENKKEMSLIAAKRLFPNYDLRDPNRKTERAQKEHDGLIDSLLIAEYVRRMFKNK